MAQAIHGFVEELVVNDDPEYQVQVYMYVHVLTANKTVSYAITSVGKSMC